MIKIPEYIVNWYHRLHYAGEWTNREARQLEAVMRKLAQSYDRPYYEVCNAIANKAQVLDYVTR